MLLLLIIWQIFIRINISAAIAIFSVNLVVILNVLTGRVVRSSIIVIQVLSFTAYVTVILITLIAIRLLIHR